MPMTPQPFHAVLLAKAHQRLGMSSGPAGIAAHRLENASVAMGEGERRRVSALLGATHGRSNNPLRSFDLAERPQSQREIEFGRHADVVAKAMREMAVPLTVVPRDRHFEVLLGGHKVTAKKAGRAEDAMSNHGHRRTGLMLGLAQERVGHFEHRRELA